MSVSVKSKKIQIYEYVFAPVIGTDGEIEAVAGTARDITARKTVEQHSWNAANYDFLTGLPNRRLFRDRLEQAVKHSERTGLPLALLFIDLDLFKKANDSLGHDGGDLLLRQTAQRIGPCIRGTDTASRIGGDEFTVILSEITQIKHVEILAREILNALASPFHILQNVVHISGSIGITISPQDGIEPQKLVSNADQAMYIAKSNGRNGFSFYTKNI